MRVRVVEVGPRDGLQNEKAVIPTAVKLAFVQALQGAGFTEIEATSFVHPKWVPQLADAEELSKALGNLNGLTALVPNLKGLERAIACGYRSVAVFTAASETFSQRNTNRSIAESLTEFASLMPLAQKRHVRVRGYVSTAFECPFEGRMDVGRVVDVAEKLLALGIDEVSLGDTIGVAGPREVEALVKAWRPPLERLALHFHDTCGTALANVYAGLQNGVRVFDSSAGGLGGCPYAPGATGNLATEDLLYFLDRMGYETGVRLPAVAAASRALSQALGGRELPSRVLHKLG